MKTGQEPNQCLGLKSPMVCPERISVPMPYGALVRQSCHASPGEGLGFIGIPPKRCVRRVATWALAVSLGPQRVAPTFLLTCHRAVRQWCEPSAPAGACGRKPQVPEEVDRPRCSAIRGPRGLVLRQLRPRGSCREPVSKVDAGTMSRRLWWRQ